MAICISPSLAASTGLDAAEQFHQVSDLDVFERTHGILDLPAQPLISAAGHELVELLDGLLPGERPGREPWVVLHIVAVRLAALEPDGHPARDLAGVTGREAIVWPHLDLSQQTLYVRLLNPLGAELDRLDVAIQGGDGQQIGEAVVGVFFR